MENKEIFYLMSCDEYKTYSSMRLVCITTSKERIKEVIYNEIKGNDMNYHNDAETNKRQAEIFAKDFDKVMSIPREKRNLNKINSRLDYGFLECVIDGEVL